MGHLPVGQCQIGNQASTVSEKLRPPFIFVAGASLSTYGGREVRPKYVWIGKIGSIDLSLQTWPGSVSNKFRCAYSGPVRTPFSIRHADKQPSQQSRPEFPRLSA